MNRRNVPYGIRFRPTFWGCPEVVVVVVVVKCVSPIAELSARSRREIKKDKKKAPCLSLSSLSLPRHRDRIIHFSWSCTCAPPLARSQDFRGALLNVISPETGQEEENTMSSAPDDTTHVGFRTHQRKTEEKIQGSASLIR